MPQRGSNINSTAFFTGSFEAPSPQGFAIGGLLRGVGRVAGAVLGLPPRVPGGGGPVPPAQFLPRGTGAGGLRIPAGSKAADNFIRQLTGGAFPDFGDVRSGASSTAPGVRVVGGRRRRLNPLNLRALTRADRRLTRFAKIASRYIARSAPQRRVRAFKRRKR